MPDQFRPGTVPGEIVVGKGVYVCADDGAFTLGTVEVAGPGSRLGAPGSRTGSRVGFSLCRRQLQPVTKTRVAVTTARRVDDFINRLLREFVVGLILIGHADIIIPD